MNNGIVITNPIYPFTIFVFKGDNLEELHSFAKEHITDKLDIQNIESVFNNRYRGQTLRLYDSDVFIHFTERAGTGTICHEAFHAVEVIMDRIGNPHNGTMDESWAYFLAFVTKEIVEQLYQDQND